MAGGGIGDLWRCIDEPPGHTVAIKILAPFLLKEPGFTERFRARARAAASIDRPTVVNIQTLARPSA